VQRIHTKRKPLYRGLRTDPQHPWRAENVGRLLIVATTKWQEALLEGFRHNGFQKLRTPYLNLMRHIDMDGTPLTELADRVGITKQSVSELISTCVRLGLVSAVDHPNDRRAKVVIFTDYGRAAMLAGQWCIEELDGELIALMGASRFNALRDSLRLIADWDGNVGSHSKAKARPRPARTRPKKSARRSTLR
jgi:DNA-binding MarR family transcriptional regulator